MECPKGFYCPLSSTSILACPLGTYGDKTRLISQTECTSCPSGYLCNKLNITDFKLYPCPIGSYCNQRALYPTACPEGTYNPTKGGRSLDDCATCPAGYYCPMNTSTPIRCPSGTDCPEGSKFYSTCPGGYYCNSETDNQKVLCPVNFYCPRGAKQPLPCSGREICPEGSEISILCGAGYYVQTQASDQYINTCSACPQGTYSTVYQEGCSECPEGYLCYGRTNRPNPTLYNEHHGEVCPKGYYCPKGSYSATPCPVGTYNAEFGATKVT